MVTVDWLVVQFELVNQTQHGKLARERHLEVKMSKQDFYYQPFYISYLMFYI